MLHRFITHLTHLIQICNNKREIHVDASVDAAIFITILQPARTGALAAAPSGSPSRRWEHYLEACGNMAEILSSYMD